MRISDWSSDVCSSDLLAPCPSRCRDARVCPDPGGCRISRAPPDSPDRWHPLQIDPAWLDRWERHALQSCGPGRALPASQPLYRSEEHTSELQSLMRISYAVFCLKKKTNTTHQHTPL